VYCDWIKCYNYDAQHAEILKTFEASLKACKTGFEENYDHRNFYTVNIRNNTFPGVDSEFPVRGEMGKG